jgi:hypothetical protein
MTERGNHHAPTSAIERIYAEWDEALGAKDTDSSMALYHPDATLESPLVCHLLGTGEGVVRGREAIAENAAWLRQVALGFFGLCGAFPPLRRAVFAD